MSLDFDNLVLSVVIKKFFTLDLLIRDTILCFKYHFILLCFRKERVIKHARNVQYTVVYSARLFGDETRTRKWDDRPKSLDGGISASADNNDKRTREPKTGTSKNVKSISEDSMNLTENTVFSKKLNEKLNKIDKSSLPWKMVSRYVA